MFSASLCLNGARLRATLTGNLHGGAALHYGADSIPHDAAVVAGVRPVQ